MTKKKTKTSETKAARSKAKSQESSDEMAAKEVMRQSRAAGKKITASSTAEYFSKNLQQVGFSSSTKAVLTTLKEAVDNSLDACEEHEILPEIKVKIKKKGPGSMKGADHIMIVVEDNGPGLGVDDIPKVFGEYLASSKFGRGRCSRGQQGIGISAATTWAMQTTATGALVITKQAHQQKAISCKIDMDLKNNKGVLRDKKAIDWKNKKHGTSVEFHLDGRIQLKGEAGILTYIRGTILLNPHLKMIYDIGDEKKETVDRVSEEVPKVPAATDPHPHTMKLGEFISHARLFDGMSTKVWLKKGFSRITESVITDLKKTAKIPEAMLTKKISAMTEGDLKSLFQGIQKVKLLAPATNTVLSVGEDGLALSINRLGDVDYFAVLTRKPTIADFKPVQIEVAIARLREGGDADSAVQVLRFANRVPLQFDKASCAIVKAITSVAWKNYGIRQPKGALPLGPYIVAVSVVSPFIKFKNASKETIDASDELVEELRRALMQAGQRLSRYLRKESKATDLEQKVLHIEQFGPILIETLGRVLESDQDRKDRATAGLRKILEKDTKGIKQDLKHADQRLTQYLDKKKERLSGFFDQIKDERSAAKKKAKADAAAAREGSNGDDEYDFDEDQEVETGDKKSNKKSKKSSAKKKKSVSKKVAKKSETSKKAKSAKKAKKKK